MAANLSSKPNLRLQKLLRFFRLPRAHSCPRPLPQGRRARISRRSPLINPDKSRQSIVSRPNQFTWLNDVASNPGSCLHTGLVLKPVKIFFNTHMFTSSSQTFWWFCIRRYLANNGKCRTGSHNRSRVSAASVGVRAQLERFQEGYIRYLVIINATRQIQ